MKFTPSGLRAVFDRTSGYCHICHRKLAFKNYAVSGVRGAWEIEHSLARALGGTDHGNNLYAAHIACNREKGSRSSRAVRAIFGKTRAPLSRSSRKKVKVWNAVLGGMLGVLVGGLLGPGPRLVCGVIGAIAGHKRNPDK